MAGESSSTVSLAMVGEPSTGGPSAGTGECVACYVLQEKLVGCMVHIPYTCNTVPARQVFPLHPAMLQQQEPHLAVSQHPAELPPPVHQ